MNDPLRQHPAEVMNLNALIQWATSNLAHPAMLDLIACYFVSKALCAARGFRNGDGDWVISAGRATVGVFVAQAPPVSENRRIPRVSFIIPNHFEWEDHSTYDLECCPTDVYVFAIFAQQETDSLNLTDPNQWTFYVLGFKRLEGWSPVNKRVSLKSVLNSGAIRASLDKLADTIERIHKDQWSDDWDEDEE